MKSLQEQVYKELTGNILPFWSTCARDNNQGGCYGEMDASGNANVTADKSVILHARVLWSWSESYLKLQKNVYLQEARHFYEYMVVNFIDQAYEGAYYEVSFDGEGNKEYKSIVAQSYVIFAFSAYFQASGDPFALLYAKQIMQKIEAHAKDSLTGKYYADLTQDWQALPTVQSSVSASTYLHLIEAYTALLTCEKNDSLVDSLTQLVNFFIDHIIDAEYLHIKQNFALSGCADVTGKRYGHDLEAAWLLVEAAKAINNPLLSKKCESVALSLIEQVIKEHDTSDYAHLHGISWGVNTALEVVGNAEQSRVAWVQAEALSALSWAYAKTNKQEYKTWLLGTWFYIENYLVDAKYKDWFEGCNENGSLDKNNVKIGPWKCPYHSVRGCVNFLSLLNNEQYNQDFSQVYAQSYASGFHLNKKNKEAS